MEPPCPLISWVNPFPRRFINRTIFFCNAWIAWMRLLPAVWSKTILLSFLEFHWLFPLLARETSSGNCSIYKSTRERVDSNGLYGRWRLHLMGSWKNCITTREQLLWLFHVFEIANQLLTCHLLYLTPWMNGNAFSFWNVNQVGFFIVRCFIVNAISHGCLDWISALVFNSITSETLEQEFPISARSCILFSIYLR